MNNQPVSDTQRRLVMLCAVLGIVLGGLDGAIANIALPTIAKDLSCSETLTVWIVNGYQLAVAVSLLPAAALAESLGLKKCTVLVWHYLLRHPSPVRFLGLSVFWLVLVCYKALVEPVWPR